MYAQEHRLPTRKCIGYISSYLPQEVIWACGMTPVRLRPGPSLAAADGYLPRNFSVEARGLLASALDGSLSAGSSLTPAIQAAVFLDEDDTSRRFFDVWRANVDIPALGLVALPRLSNDLACRRYAGALIEMAESLAALSGQPLTADGLFQAIDLYNEQRRLLRSLRGRWMDGELPSEDWYDLRWQTLTSDPVIANAELAARLCEKAPTRPGPDWSRRLILLGGGHIPRQFLTFLESCGARVVAEDSEADERTLTTPVSLELAPPDIGIHLQALAAAYLNKPSGPRPNALSRRLDSLVRLLDERCVNGVIALYPKFADSYLGEYVELAEIFHQHGAPALLLEDDGESGFSGQQRTRVEAFLEMLA